MTKKKERYWDSAAVVLPAGNVRVVSRKQLKNLRHVSLKHLRGFKGTTLGPASPGRKLSQEEKLAIEQKLRDEGKI